MTASVAAGQLEVIVPADATVELRGRVTVGQLRLPGQGESEARGGVDIDEDLLLDGSTGGGTLVLDLQVGIGEVVVSRG